MPQYFIDQKLQPGSTAVITGEDFHHLSRVRRAKPGDPLLLRDSEGQLYEGWISEIHEHELIADVASPAGGESLLPELVLGMALLKNKNFELVIQKSVEVGVSSIVPLVTERTVPDIEGKEDKKLERWRTIAEEASKQSMRSSMPAVEPVSTFKDFVARSHKGFLVCAHPSREGLTLRKAAEGCDRSCSVVLVGPEGGFSPSELALAQQKGFVNVNIGETQMRAETAGIVLPALVIYELMSGQTE
jgi:16S rRNA (uracil1498-N3)-methyltransferase